MSIEAQTAALLRQASSPADFAEVINRLKSWFSECVSEEGLLLGDPWRTHVVLPAIYRLRTALDGLGWTKWLEGRLCTLTAAVLRTASPVGWFMDGKAGVSDRYRKMLVQMTGEVGGLRPWRNVPRWLWNARGKRTRLRPPEPGFQSDGAAVAVLRRDWSEKSAVTAVDHHGQDFRVVMQILGTTIIDGVWECHAIDRGKPLPIHGPWEATCWFGDDDGEYLELSTRLRTGIQVDRQVFLPRRADMIWLADTLKTKTASDLQLEWRLPAASASRLTGCLPTRAQRVGGLDFDLRLLSVGTPVHPMAPANGRLVLENGMLKLSARAEAVKRLHLPLVLTWNRSASTDPTTWRQLTITNDRRRVAADEAVAFRVAHAGRNIVFYRALGGPKRYAFLGHQTLYECVIGEFGRDGDIDEWLMVEG